MQHLPWTSETAPPLPECLPVLMQQQAPAGRLNIARMPQPFEAPNCPLAQRAKIPNAQARIAKAICRFFQALTGRSWGRSCPWDVSFQRHSQGSGWLDKVLVLAIKRERFLHRPLLANLHVFGIHLDSHISAVQFLRCLERGSRSRERV